MADAAAEVAGLDKVLTRLAFTEDVQLEQVLHKLIPAVLRQLKSPHDATRRKVMEIMGAVNKRLKGCPTLRLPLADLLALAVDSQVPPLVRSFGLVYTEVAFERSTPQERLTVVGPLLQGVSARPAQQRTLCLRLALSGLEGLTQSLATAVPGLPPSVAALLAERPAAKEAAGNLPGRQPEPGARPMEVDPPASDASGGGRGGPASTTTTTPVPGWQAPAEILRQFPFLGDEGDRRAFLGAATTLLLYVPQPTGPKVTTPLQAAALQGGPSPPTPPDAPPPPPGLSAADVAGLADKTGALPAGDTLVKRKLGVLNFLAGGVAPASELCVPLLVASCDPSDAVSRRGEELVKRLCATDGLRPDVDLEHSPQLLIQLFELFHGSAGPAPSIASGGRPGGDGAAGGGGAGGAAGGGKQPASAALRSRILGLLCRSVAAAAVFPQTLLTIQEAVYGAGGAGGAASSSARLRAQGMEFAVWVSRHCPPHQLKAMAPAVLQGLLRALDLGPSSTPGEALPPPSDHTALTLRGFAYQAVGALASRVPTALAGRVDVATAFFTALGQEAPGLRATVSEATSALSAAFTPCPPDVAPAVAQLLSSCVDPGRPDAVRAVGLQWANRVFPLNYVPARWLCVRGAGDTKLEVREEAARGLRLSPQSLDPEPSALNPAAGPTSASDLPSLSDLLAHALEQCPGLGAPADPHRSLPLPPRSYLALVQFAGLCATPPPGSPPPSPPPDVYLTLLEGCLCRDATADLLTASLHALLHAARTAPSVVESRAAQRLSVLRLLLGHVDGGVRLAAARLLGLAAAALFPTGVTALLNELVGWFGVTVPTAPNPTTTPTGVGAGVGGAATAATASAAMGPPRFELQDGSLLAAGFVVAQCVGAGVSNDVPEDAIRTTAAALLHAAQHQPSSLLCAVAVHALGHVGIAGGADTLAHLLSAGGDGAKTGPDPTSPPPPPPASAAAPAPQAVGAGGGGEGVTVQELDTCLGPHVAALYTRTTQLIADRDPKVAARAITGAGLLAWSWALGPAAGSSPAGPSVGDGDSEMTDAGRACPPTPPTLSPAYPTLDGRAAAESAALRWLLAALLATRTVKSEEGVFAVGEALALLFGGVQLSPATVLRTPFPGLASAFGLLRAEPAPPPPPGAAAELDTVSGSGEDSAARTACQTVLLHQLLHVLPLSTHPQARCSGAVWAVSLLTYSGTHARVQAGLPGMQDALSGLLGDPNDLTQDMASRGVSLVYRLGNTEQKAALVTSLVAVLQGTAQGRAKVKVQADTQVLEEGALPAPPTAAGGGGGSQGTGEGLTTYRELCSLATELGSPDLVYRFMDLAHHTQALATRRGAAYGLVGMSALAGEALTPYLPQLIPKLYRYTYDPNPRVSDAMSGIWRAVVPDPARALDTHFTPVMNDLLTEMGGRLWRNRQAACGACADLLTGRRWAELQPHLARLWTMTLRALDDVKETVRVAAGGLARTLRGVTLRLCDPTLSSPPDARAAYGMVLPVLLEQGLPSPVPEVRGVCLDVMSKASSAAGREALLPHLAPLVQALLEGLSGLEDSRLNYVEQHAGRLGIDTERLDNARSAAARSSPLGDTLDLAARVAGSDASAEGGGCLPALLPVLSGVLTRGVGLATKTGTARFIRQLTSRAGQALRPHAPALLKPLLVAIRKERSVAVRKAYAGAIAQVCAVAGAKRVEWVVEQALTLYGTGGGDDDGGSGDSSARLCGALIARELLRVSPDTFNTHAQAILPVAYGGRMDVDADVAAQWASVWEEGVSSEAGSVRLYAQEITRVLVEGLGSGQWGRKRACAAAVTALTELGSDVLPADSVGSLTTALLDNLPGRVWEGKEALVTALGHLVRVYPAHVASSVPGGAARLVTAALGVAGRRSVAFRGAGLQCLTLCLRAYPDTDWTPQVWGILLESLTRHLQVPAAAAKEDPGQGEEDGPPPPLPLPEVLACVSASFAGFRPAIPRPLDHVTGVVGAVAGVLSSPLPWPARLAALGTARAMCDACGRATGTGADALVTDGNEGGSGALALAALRRGCAELLGPVGMVCDEVRVSQVTTAALECGHALLDLTGPDVPPEVAARLAASLHALLTRDSTAPSAADSARRMQARLRALHPSLPTTMEA